MKTTSKSKKKDVVQVVPLSLSASPCGLMICRDFFLGGGDFVDEFEI